MPFKSKAQMRYLYANEPEVAKEFASKTKNPKALPERAKKREMSKAAEAFYSELAKVANAISEAMIEAEKSGKIFGYHYAPESVIPKIKEEGLKGTLDIPGAWKTYKRWSKSPKEEDVIAKIKEKRGGPEAGHEVFFSTKPLPKKFDNKEWLDDKVLIKADLTGLPIHVLSPPGAKRKGEWIRNAPADLVDKVLKADLPNVDPNRALIFQGVPHLAVDGPINPARLAFLNELGKAASGSIAEKEKGEISKAASAFYLELSKVANKISEAMIEAEESIPPRVEWSELEDITYGLEHGYELRPSRKRIMAAKRALRLSGDPAIRTALELWESGHGVLPTHKRIEAFNRAFELEKLSEEFAPGIPGDRAISEIRPAEGEVWPVVLQEHKARNKHYDLRLGDPEKKVLYSWALPKGLPNIGEKRLAVRQPDHSWDYQDFEGKIPGGTYGAGTVRATLKTPGEVLQAGPDAISFNTYNGRDNNYYKMVKTDMDDNRWLIINHTPSSKSWAEGLTPKGTYKSTAIGDIDLADPNLAMQEKIDGAAVNVVLRKGRPIGVFSPRPTDREPGVISHSPRIKSVLNVRSPLPDTVLRGELYAADKDGKALPASQIGGILNSNVWKSRDLQDELGHLKLRLHDVIRHDSEDYSDAAYNEKWEVLQEIHDLLPQLELPALARTPKEKSKMLKDVLAGRNKNTTEGVVLWPWENPGPPIKAKVKMDEDVVIRNIFPSKREGEAGGFEYSDSPDSPIRGKVGTGFTRELRKMMMSQPEDFLGHIAVIEAMEKFPSGALRAPAYKGLHLDKQ